MTEFVNIQVKVGSLSEIVKVRKGGKEETTDTLIQRAKNKLPELRHATPDQVSFKILEQ